MATTGLVDNINKAVLLINAGRKGFATKGKAEEGRVFYEDGIAEAMSAFKEAQATADPYKIILAEYTFLMQELQFTNKNDKDTFNSLTLALQLFDDSFSVLKIAEDKKDYHIVDKAIPHIKKYREKGYPKDALHIACSSHKARIKNTLSAPGINQIEKDLLKQRRDNLFTAQESYIEKQKKALAQ